MAEEHPGFAPVVTRRDAYPHIGIGMLGYRFMGRAHANAYQRLAPFFWPPAAWPRLVALCGRNEPAVAEAAVRFGFEGYYTDWRRLLDDPRIRLFDNAASADAHAAPCIAAAQAGKHILCEKPLALSAADAYAMWQAAEGAHVKHLTGFNYRFVPAIRYLKELLLAGELGQVFQFRARYLQMGGDDPQRPFTWRYDRAQGGYNALGDIGVHIIDLARFLVGEIAEVSAMTATFVRERPLPDRPEELRPVTTDDAFVSTVRFADGVLGTLEASKVATGHRNQNTIEINGSLGSAIFDLERLNELQLYRREQPGQVGTGFADVFTVGRGYPYGENWWPGGHIIGWEHAFVHEVEHLIRCIVRDEPVAPWGATFEDGYRALVVAEASLRAAEEGRKVVVAASE